LTNNGTEAHEMFVFRFNDDVDLSAAEVVALPEEEAMTKVTPIGGGFALPGATGYVVADLSEPGRYGMACFIPQGATPDKLEALESGAETGGAPHHTLGMAAEFEVAS
jgi:hypothetical protein